MRPYPLLLKGRTRSRLWGREIWCVSGRPDAPSVVTNGPLAGRELPDLVREFGEELVGTRARGAETFPLLVKVIEADERLSLQVHPNAFTAPRTGGEPKSEMWYVLDNAPGASILAGLRDGVDRATLEAAMRTDRVEDAVARVEARRGDIFFIPGGLIHSIGGGYRVYEVQQSSDTTFRFHDWNRTDPATGRPRELHLRQSFEAIDWTLPQPRVIPKIPYGDDHNTRWDVLNHPSFSFRCLNLREPARFPGDEESCLILRVTSGACRVGGVPSATGADLLVPAGAPLTLEPEPGGAHLLITTL